MNEVEQRIADNVQQLGTISCHCGWSVEIWEDRVSKKVSAMEAAKALLTHMVKDHHLKVDC